MNEMNNMMQQQPWGAFNGYNTGFVGGQTFGAPVMPKMTNPLTQEEREALAHGNQFTLQVTKEELAAGICTHKDPATGQYATVQNADGSCTCAICHTTFWPNLVTEDYVKEHTSAFLNILETSKLLGVDLNDDVIRGVFQMTPFVKKMPELFKMAQTSFYRYNEQNPYAQQVANPNTFSMFNNVVGGMPMMGQPVQMPQYGYAQQYAQPQPMMQTPYMQQQAQMVGGASAFYQTPQQPMMGQPMMQQPMMQQPMNNVQVPQQQAQQTEQQPVAGGQVEVNAQMGL